MFRVIAKIASRVVFAALPVAAPQVVRSEMTNYQDCSGPSRSRAEVLAAKLKKLKHTAKIEAAIENISVIRESIKAPEKHASSRQGSDLSAKEYEKALAEQTANC